MEAITHLNTQIAGIPFLELRGLEINHYVNGHAMAVITVEVDSDMAQNIAKRADEKQTVQVTTTAAGQPNILFEGVLSNVGIDIQGEYVVATLTVKSYSVLADFQKCNQSFQNKSESHETVIQKALQGAINLELQVSDSPIGRIVVQCNETAFEFAERMASELEAPVVASIYRPLLTVGIPQGTGSYTLSDYDFDASSGTTTGQSGMQNMPQGNAARGLTVETMQYAYIGDRVALNGEQRVKGVFASMQSGILKTRLTLSTPDGFKQRTIVNTQISGKMYLGEVKAVKLDQVQVHLVDIDSSYASDSNVWLPYSTAYSSSDGSGFYCMPAVGDQVRVFFPGSDEGQAFAASSVCQSPAANITDKQWTGPKGRRILLAEEGIFITTNSDENKIFINLTDENGISIVSDKNINICAKKNLSLISNDSITVTAQNDILLSSAEAYIDITPEKIELSADSIMIK